MSTNRQLFFKYQKQAIPDRVMEGELDEIIEALIHYDQSTKMAGEQ